MAAEAAAAPAVEVEVALTGALEVGVARGGRGNDRRSGPAGKGDRGNGGHRAHSLYE